ncbi:MAG: hypothetical protein ACREIC_04700, partial [Limisphaerales bacterium]
IEKLHSVLKRRGFTLSVSALAAGLTGEAVSAAPAGFAAGVAGAALTASAGAGALSTTIIKTLSMTKLHIAIAGSIVAAGMAIPLTVQHRSQTRLQTENAQLRQQMQELVTANSALSNTVSHARSNPVLGNDEERELLRLRGEVGTLKRQLAEVSRTQAKALSASSAEQTDTNSVESLKQVAIARMTYAKVWMLAFFRYSQKNQGQFPTNFNQALPFWPTDVKFTTDNGEVTLQPDESVGGTPQFGLVQTNYDIVYQGSINTLTNPQSIIVIREKDAWQTPDGGLVRAYAFADGHSEIHKAVDGDFLPWEQQHMAMAEVPPGQ